MPGATALTYAYSQIVNGGNSSQVGLAKSFEVQPGDVLDLEVYAKYEEPTTTGNNVNALASSLITAFGLNTTSSNPLDGQQAYNAFNSTFSAGKYIGRVPPYEDGAAPKAYLNYILFNENFELEDFGFDQISTTAKQVGSSPFVTHDLLALHVKVQKKGYLYIYLSNEQAVQTNVYFDDLKITHHTGVEQVSDYYPFGLTFNSYSRENSVKQDYLYNSKEIQDELNVGWYDYQARQYDPAIGRFLSADPAADLMRRSSPYAYAFDNPVRFTDPDGMIPFDGVERREDFDRDKFDFGPASRAPINRDRGVCRDCEESNQTFHFRGEAPHYIGGNGDPKKKKDDKQPKKEDAPNTENQPTLEDLKKGPPQVPGYVPPKSGDRRERNPNGKGSGWIDRNGDVWIPTDHNGTHAPHWERQIPGGGYENVYPTVTKVVTVVVVAVVVYEVVKWGVAIFLAPETFGGSLGVAAAMP